MHTAIYMYVWYIHDCLFAYLSKLLQLKAIYLWQTKKVFIINLYLVAVISMHYEVMILAIIWSGEMGAGCGLWYSILALNKGEWTRNVLIPMFTILNSILFSVGGWSLIDRFGNAFRNMGQWICIRLSSLVYYSVMGIGNNHPCQKSFMMKIHYI